MAYNNKYKITVATKTGKTSYLYLLENDYVGDVYEYLATSLQLEFIPNSDDLFETIYVSQINVQLDVTEYYNGTEWIADLSVMPDFTTLNDRKYKVELYSDEDLEWVGWALSDNVQFNFSTGRKYLSFNAIDGLGILDKIPYQLSTTDYLTTKYTCLDIVQSCLSNVGYDMNLISGISFYADGMLTRDDDPENEPLIQTYLNYSNLVNDQNEAINCLDILKIIVGGFASRLFQSNGKWYIVPLTQLAQNSYYFTEYDTTGTVVTSGTKSLTTNIEGYTGNTSNTYFVDNSQLKIFKKGYNKVSFKKTIENPTNYITNWDLKNFEYVNPLLGYAYGWTENRGDGVIYVKNMPNLAYNIYILGFGIGSTVHEISVSPNNIPKTSINGSLSLSFNCSWHGAPVSGPTALLIVKMIITNPVSGNTYSLKNDAENNPIWDSGSSYIYYIPFDPAQSSNDIEINTPIAPDSGELTLEFIIADSAGGYPVYTIYEVELSNFRLAVDTSFKEFTTISYSVDSLEYVYDAQIGMGFNDVLDGYYSYRGFISDSTGYTLKDWFRLEYPDIKYRSLSELAIQQYVNCLNKNIINLDATVSSIETTNGRISGAMRFTADDTDPAQISVEGKKYLLGNSTIDYASDIVQSTFLETNDLNADYIVTTTYNTSTQQVGGLNMGRNRSTGYMTKEAAFAAPLTEFRLYLVQGDYYSPSVGDVYYSDPEFLNPFNGAALWWKVMVDDLGYSAFKISSSGIITEIYG
jgi:hypothetical protein